MNRIFVNFSNYQYILLHMIYIKNTEAETYILLYVYRVYAMAQLVETLR